MGKRQVQREALLEVPVRTNSQQRYARVVGIRGGGQYDVVAEATPTSTQSGNNAGPETIIVLVQLASKLRKVVYVKLGGFVLIELFTTAATKVLGDILGVLRPEHIKILKADGMWNSAINAPKSVITESYNPAELSNNEVSDADASDNDDLFVNRNRMHIAYETDEEEEEKKEGAKKGDPGKLAKKAQKTQKQETKKAKTQTKQASKLSAKEKEKTVKNPKAGKGKSATDEDEDIDLILSNFQKELEAKEAVTEEHCPPPSRRSCGAFVANPIDLNELILFAGEYYDGQRVSLFADFFVYNIDKNDWRKITSPNSPAPRSSHQLVITNAGRGFLFGGEFVSSNQTTFFHYKDFWALDLKTYSWEKLEVGKKPSPRSGHRMVLWKHYIILFGGFYDAGNETRYLDDLHIFDTVECKWTVVVVPEPKPTKRSGFDLIVSGDILALYGGYTKEVVKGKIARGIVHTDLWTLKLSFDINEWKWEKRKRGGISPQPRSGAPMISFKGKGFMFGGVYDIKEDDETIESVCSDDFFQLNVEQCRFYPVNLKVSPTAQNVKPSPRFNAMIFGGILEKDDKEITFADLHTVDLDKLTAFRTIISDDQAMTVWAGEESEDDDDDDDEDEDDDSNNNDNSDDEDKFESENDELDKVANETKSKKASKIAEEIASEEEQENLEIEVIDLAVVSELEETDESIPRVVVFEDPLFDTNKPVGTDSNLRDYFTRTQEYWLKKALDDENEDGGDTSGKPPVKSKEIRRYAFILAEEAWEEAVPRVQLERVILAENEVATKEAAKGRDASSTERRGRRV
ncbi:hypothetical protein HK100_005532 [Physocladia obscura]|uniref:DUF4110 domain-containing protein n=1 Tax=Physocladia obscura TaxID=109957 RepID=A0AAD5XC92_9FUNG|nr:hypothetical protein HK100_005532 [Physocladia obscura]